MAVAYEGPVLERRNPATLLSPPRTEPKLSKQECRQTIRQHDEGR